MARVAMRLPLLLCSTPVLASVDVSWVEWLRGNTRAAALDALQEPAALVRPRPSDDAWAPITQLLQGWQFTSEYAVAVGTAEHGRLFKYEGGKFKLNTKIPTGSTSKWPSAMMFAGLVADDKVKSLDDPVNMYLPWWTKDPKDPRSTVTLKMLLSFTSGFGDGHPGEEANTRAGREWREKNGVQRAPHVLQERLTAKYGDGAIKCNTTSNTVIECAKSIYENVTLIGTPGQVYSYNSNHLQLAAALAVTVTGLEIHEYIKQYLLVPFNMSSSYYEGKCPDFGGSLITTGADYEQFLAHLLSYKALNKKVIDASEADYTPFLEGYTLYGDYGFGHFLWCFDSVKGMTEACREERIHVDPGAFGFIPMIDRKRGYYIEIVAAEIAPTGSYPLSGIPEYLAVALKPHVDAVLAPTPAEDAAHLTHSPELLSLAIADVNYCLNCVKHPEKCS